jgi:hypothetical protein
MLAFITMTAGDAYAGMGPHGEADNSEVGDEAAGSLTATRLGKRQCAGNRGMVSDLPHLRCRRHNEANQLRRV